MFLERYFTGDSIQPLIIFYSLLIFVFFSIVIYYLCVFTFDIVYIVNSE